MLEYLLNYKLIFIIIFFLLFLIFKDKILNKKKVVINENKNKIVEFDKTNTENFIKSDTFTGVKEGYVFKTDDLGTGYYLDDLKI